MIQKDDRAGEKTVVRFYFLSRRDLMKLIFYWRVFDVLIIGPFNFIQFVFEWRALNSSEITLDIISVFRCLLFDVLYY